MKIKDGKAPCPCQSNTPLELCCGPIIFGKQAAPNAQAVMRARYTANVKRAYKYLADSWHPEHRPKKLNAGSKTNWLVLKVLDFVEKDDKAWVEFQAFYGHADHQHALHEKSFFVRENDQWWYVDGEILAQEHCGHGH